MKPGYQDGRSITNNVHHFLDKHLSEKPNQVLFRWFDQKLGRHESMDVKTLYHLVNKTAAGLKALGISRGDRAIVFIPMSVPMYVAMFALQKIGAIPVFLDSWARRDQLGVSAEIVNPKAIVSVERAFQYLAEVEQIRNIPIRIVAGPSTAEYTAKLETLMAGTANSEVEPVEKEETALITFTTGSSGKPKGANRTHRFLFAQHYALNPCLPYEAKDVDLPVFPIFSLNNLASGVTTVIPAFDIGVPGEKDPEVLLGQIQECGVTCVTLSPSLFNRLSAHCLKNNIKLPQLRRIVTGGAPVSRDNISDMSQVAQSAQILVLFGSTEVEPMADIEGKEMLEMKSRAMSDNLWVDEGVNVGRMVDTLRYKFIHINKGQIIINSATDWKALEVPSGEVGELIVAGEHVCQGYYNDDEAFHRAKIRDADGTIWHRTGDLGRVDENGYLWIVGRVHNAIARAGKYQFPVRAEMVLKKIQEVDRVAYLGISDEKLGERAVAVLTRKNGADAENLLIAKAKEILDYNGIPADQIVVVDQIPMDPRHNSKVEYEILRKSLLEKRLV